MTIKTFTRVFAVAAFTASMAYASDGANTQDIKPADSVGGLQLGQLSCEIEGGWGLLLGSSKAANCTFARTDGTTETYSGKLDKIGLDIGKTEDAYMTWAVFTNLDTAPGAGALLGSYSGLSAEASLGIGLGANALVGGNGQNIGLQPLALQGNTGLNIAVGLASLTLDAVTN